MKKVQLFTIILFFVFGFAFFVLNFLTPLLHDDFAYLFKFGPKAEVRPTEIPVKSISDVFDSIYWHYLDVNGRFTPHFLLQLLLLIGKLSFNILNTAVFLAIPFLISKLFNVNSENKIWNYLFVFLWLWFLMPFFGQTMLWTTGAINYLWTCFLVLVFLLLLKNTENHVQKSYVEGFLLFIISIFIGWSNESVTLGLAAALFFYVLKHFKTIKLPTALMIVGFWLGVSLIVFSPGTFNRVNNEVGMSESGFLEIGRKKLLDIIAIMYFLKYNLLVTIVLLFVYIKKGGRFKRFFNDNFLVLLSFIFTVIFVFLVGKIEERVLFGAAFYLLLINVFLLKESVSKISKTLLIPLFSLIFLLFAINYFQAFTYIKSYSESVKGLETRIKENKNHFTWFPKYEDSRFVYHTLGELSDQKNYHNRVRGFYFHVPEVAILPQDFYNKLLSNQLLTPKNSLNGWDASVYFSREYKTLMVKVPQNYVYDVSLSSVLFSENEEIQVIEKVKIISYLNEKIIILTNVEQFQNVDKIIIKTVNLPAKNVFIFNKK